jgi:hypothetical protein
MSAEANGVSRGRPTRGPDGTSLRRAGRVTHLSYTTGRCCLVNLSKILQLSVNEKYTRENERLDESLQISGFPSSNLRGKRFNNGTMFSLSAIFPVRRCRNDSTDRQCSMDKLLLAGTSWAMHCYQKAYGTQTSHNWIDSSGLVLLW